MQTVQARGAFCAFAWRSGGVKRLVWHTSGGKNCPFCTQMDGKTAGIDESFVGEGDTLSGGDGQGLTPSRNISHEPLHEGCLPGDAYVLPQGVTGVSKRRYDGNLVAVSTARGYRLSCTPNHPILTPSGWVGASRLDVGGYVISRLAGDAELIVCPDYENVPARIQDVVESFSNRREVVSVPVPVAPKHFHGDGEGSKVAIIGANRLLLDGLDTALAEQVAQDVLVGGDGKASELSGGGHPGELLMGIGATALGDVGGLGLGFTLGGGQSGGSQSARLLAGAWRKRDSVQIIDDDGPRDSEIAGHGKDGIAILIAPDEIVNVEIDPFHGWVYNLQTESGFYFAESIIAHNCDCTIGPE